MSELRVWAPDAERPQLLVGDERVALVRQERGWWASDRPLPPGTDYSIDLGDGQPRPDPRSPWQPHGVDGPSRSYDHDSYRWDDEGWRGVDLASSVVYELHVGTFTPEGTWAAATERLDHLVDLGVSIVELLPCNTFSGERGWGYDGVLWWAPHHAYGSPDDLKAFVDGCHARGLGVVMDVVYNHLGPAGNHLPQYGPWFTSTYSTPWGDALNYDSAGSDIVRWHVFDNALMWLRDYHCDGLRLDAVHAIHDESALHLIAELQQQVAVLDPPRFLIAESDLNDPKVVRTADVGGWGVAAQWSDDFHHALHAAVTGERTGYYSEFDGPDVATALNEVFVYGGRYSPHRDRRHGAPVGNLPRTRFLGYAQNHDQVGNRAAGERLSMLVSLEQCKAVAALVLTAPFVPMLWMGEEWGAQTPWCYFTAHTDPDLAEAVREGRRGEFASFGWRPEDVPDPQALQTFTQSRLDWDEPTEGQHKELLAWYRDLIALRRERQLWTGDTSAHFDPADRCIVVRRPGVVVAATLGDSTAVLELSGTPVLAAGEVAIGDTSIRLGPWSVAVLG
ncbi:MAG: maltooligosyltrehalose trehalohydrolase [Frankiales bacterium]|nr:maltooligosyltrehalose trehalohydrolase [Frankiales bacterium]